VAWRAIVRGDAGAGLRTLPLVTDRRSG